MTFFMLLALTLFSIFLYIKYYFIQKHLLEKTFGDERYFLRSALRDLNNLSSELRYLAEDKDRLSLRLNIDRTQRHIHFITSEFTFTEAEHSEIDIFCEKIESLLIDKDFNYVGAEQIKINLQEIYILHSSLGKKIATKIEDCDDKMRKLR